MVYVTSSPNVKVSLFLTHFQLPPKEAQHSYHVENLGSLPILLTSVVKWHGI